MDENTKAVMFSSESAEWTTPADIFELLDEEFHFGIDVAATKENALCRRYLNKADDALSVSWKACGAAWMNPPYGRGIGKWESVGAAWDERGVPSPGADGHEVVC